MIERKDLGTWIDGPPRDDDYVRGAELGLPASGPGSVASAGRRFLSLCIDYGIAAVGSWAFLDYDPLGIMLLFILLNLAFQTLFGATPGQFAARVRTLPVRGAMPMLVRALIRTALLVLVIPAIYWNKDLQGGHDIAAGTAVVRA